MKKNLLIIILLLLIMAGSGSSIFLWRGQQHWKTQINELSAKTAQQQTAIAALQNQISQWTRREQQDTLMQTLNEVIYLLDLANLYLQINHDPVNAIKSLQLAQNHIERLGDPSLLTLRQTLASDLNRLNDLPVVDTAGILLKLQTLAESFSRIELIPLKFAPSLNAHTTLTQPMRPWYQQFLSTLWDNLKSLFTIRYRNSPDNPILPPDQREWLREDILFTLALAQWAVLQQKPELYQHSLRQVQQWIANNYPSNPERQKILERVEELSAIDITPASINLNASLHAAAQALKEAGMPSAKPSTPRLIPPSPETPTSPTPPLPPAGIEI